MALVAVGMAWGLACSVDGMGCPSSSRAGGRNAGSGACPGQVPAERGGRGASAARTPAAAASCARCSAVAWRRAASMSARTLRRCRSAAPLRGGSAGPPGQPGRGL